MAEMISEDVPAHFHTDRVNPEHEEEDEEEEEEEEDNHSSIGADATQTGVKNIEAVSQTWTQSSLIAAYLG